MRLTGEKLDYAISQYVDGTLNELDRRALEEQLLTDAEARLQVTQEARLTQLLRDMAAADQPRVNFDAFGAHLSALIADEPAPVAPPIPMHRVWVRRLAVAAVIALVGAVSVVPLLDRSIAPTNEPVGTAYVVGPTIETSDQPAEVRIAVGPSDILVKRGQTLSVADDTLFAPAPRVVISAGNGAGSFAMDFQPLY